MYFGEKNKAKQVITEIISSLPQQKKKFQAQWKTEKKMHMNQLWKRESFFEWGKADWN